MNHQRLVGFTLFSLSFLLFLALPFGMNEGATRPGVRLSGEWMATVYDPALVGRKHGAAWNGFVCRDYVGRPLPDHVTDNMLGLAMPGPEFYCLTVIVCNGSHCVAGVALDVPKEHRIEKDGRLYNHIDLMPGMARALEIDGLQYGGLEIYVK